MSNCNSNYKSCGVFLPFNIKLLTISWVNKYCNLFCEVASQVCGSQVAWRNSSFSSSAFFLSFILPSFFSFFFLQLSSSFFLLFPYLFFSFLKHPNQFLKCLNPKVKKYPFFQNQIKTQPHGTTAVDLFFMLSISTPKRWRAAMMVVVLGLSTSWVFGKHWVCFWLTLFFLSYLGLSILP